MYDALFDSEAEDLGIFGDGEDVDYYGEDLNNYYNEDIDDYYGEDIEAEEDAAAWEDCYYREPDWAEENYPSSAYYRYPMTRSTDPRLAAARLRAGRLRAERLRAQRLKAARSGSGYGRFYRPSPVYRYQPPREFPPTPIEPRDFPPTLQEPGELPPPSEPGDVPPTLLEPGELPPPLEPGDFPMEKTAELAEALREVLHEDYRDTTPEEMQEALFNILGTMTPAEGFNFGNVLQQIGQAGQRILRDPTVGQIAQAVLPAAGATLGTLVGGPVGTAIGGKLGQVAGQAFSGGRKPSSSPAAATMSQASPQAGSAAAAQLLQLTQNPDVLKSLASLALGSTGRSSVTVGTSGPSVPVGGVMNLLGTLAGRAAADADELLRERENSSSYLLDGEGHFRGDPAVPEDRAQALYNVLSGAENERLAAEETALYSTYP